ncbi:MAG: hypothetical protein JEZ05_06725 [Tenericutes bacterium]|nr:hypothetical protein [Mycoplasmatota bacterium]
MGLFSKKNKMDNGQNKELNELLNQILEIDKSTGTWYVLPEQVSIENKNLVIEVRKKVFEYIRQLKEAGVYGSGSVSKFAKELYPWISNQNVTKLIKLGQFL